MCTVKVLFKEFWCDKTAAAAIEYGLVAGLIGVAIIVALTAGGAGVEALFNLVVTKTAELFGSGG